MNKYMVAVIGAGPAGLYAARELAEAGNSVVLFNRDFKPGGLAEYGIYPDKEKMKAGLRKQFSNILDHENLTYMGDVVIGEGGDLTLNELRELGFQGILVTVGAQGTKWLGLPGEDLEGVFHAKTLVYHYNRLPPFGEVQYPIGRKLALIGVGNVMADIAHWAIRTLHVDEVTAIARRGPGEVKFTQKEFSYVFNNLDLAAFDVELARVKDRVEAVGQDIEQPREFILSVEKKAEEKISDTRFMFQFLSSPSRIVGDANGRVRGLEVEDTALALKDDQTKTVRLGTIRTLDVDTVIFCIGDRVDGDLGLPVVWNAFVKNPEPRFPVNEISYEAYDPELKEVIPDVFLAGWAREASSGLVGAARKDGTQGAHALMAYLETLHPATGAVERLKALLDERKVRVVSREMWNQLTRIEQAEAERRGLPSFKYASNAEMFEVLQGELEMGD